MTSWRIMNPPRRMRLINLRKKPERPIQWLKPLIKGLNLLEDLALKSRVLTKAEAKATTARANLRKKREKDQLVPRVFQDLQAKANLMQNQDQRASRNLRKKNQLWLLVLMVLRRTRVNLEAKIPSADQLRNLRKKPVQRRIRIQAKQILKDQKARLIRANQKDIHRLWKTPRKVFPKAKAIFKQVILPKEERCADSLPYIFLFECSYYNNSCMSFSL